VIGGVHDGEGNIWQRHGFEHFVENELGIREIEGCLKDGNRETIDTRWCYNQLSRLASLDH